MLKQIDESVDRARRHPAVQHERSPKTVQPQGERQTQSCATTNRRGKELAPGEATPTPVMTPPHDGQIRLEGDPGGAPTDGTNPTGQPNQPGPDDGPSAATPTVAAPTTSTDKQLTNIDDTEYKEVRGVVRQWKTHNGIIQGELTWPARPRPFFEFTWDATWTAGTIKYFNPLLS